MLVTGLVYASDIYIYIIIYIIIYINGKITDVIYIYLLTDLVIPSP